MSAAASVAAAGRPFVTILRYNRPYWKEYAAGLALAAVYSLVGLALPWVLRLGVDEFAAGSMTSGRLIAYFLVLLALEAGTGVARYWQRMLMIRASRKFEYDLRNDYFQRIQAQSREFFNRTPTGEIMARATNDMTYVRDMIGPGLMGTVDMLRVPFALAMMAYLSAHLTLVALIPIPAASVVIYVLVRYMHRQSERVQDQFGVMTARVQENLAGARVVHAYGIEDREIRAFERESSKYMRESIRLSVVTSLAWPLIGVLVGASALLTIWKGGLMVIDGATVQRLGLVGGLPRLVSAPFTLGDLSGFLWAMFLLAWPLAEFGWVLTLYQRGIVGMKRVLEYLTAEPRVRCSDDAARAIERIDGAIRFENVDFAFDGRTVLHDVTFEVSPGKTLAIVGPTGSGKSSIISLMLREYDPSRGRVLLDGIDLREIPLRVLRAQTGYVPQDTFLFSDTIRANLTFGRPEATAAEIDYAAEVAQFRETVAQLPEGYDTLLGERGVNLSGGQKQRLAIARAVIRDPRILILDDALSSVDTQTEERILRRLKHVMATRTSVLISHRVSTVRHADQILVVKDGRIVERGTHESLVQQAGIYADMYERQLLEDELEERV